MSNRNGPPHHAPNSAHQLETKCYVVEKSLPSLQILRGDDIVDDGKAVYLIRRISRPLAGSLMRAGIIGSEELTLPTPPHATGRPVLRLVK